MNQTHSPALLVFWSLVKHAQPEAKEEDNNRTYQRGTKIDRTQRYEAEIENDSQKMSCPEPNPGKEIKEN
jgi:hypothetical protein